MKHIVEPLFLSHCILVQYCFLSFLSIILHDLCPKQLFALCLVVPGLEKFFVFNKKAIKTSKDGAY